MSKNSKYVRSTPLVAIDLGTSGVRAMAAQKVDGDILRVLGYEESLKFPGYMEKGVVKHTSDAGFMIKETLRLLANRIGEKELPTTFVCTGGRSMQMSPVSSSRDWARPRVIAQELLQEMERECREKIEKNYENVGVLGLVPSYYTIDGKEQDTAPTVGQVATMIEVHYYAFVVKREVNDALMKSFDQSTKMVEASFVRPDALLSAFTAGDGYEKVQRGCAVLDFGAETTTLSIYKNGQYLATKVLPQGSNHITTLIAQQGIHPMQAEKLKCEFGYAYPKAVTKRYKMYLTSTIEPYEELCVTSGELSELIEQKLNEIMEPHIKTIRDFASRIERVYITGGGAMLQGLDQYLEEQTGVRVVYGAHDAALTRDTDDEFCSPRYSSLIGTLLLADDYRKQNNEIPQRKSKLFQTFTDLTIDFFADNQ